MANDAPNYPDHDFPYGYKITPMGYMILESNQNRQLMRDEKIAYSTNYPSLVNFSSSIGLKSFIAALSSLISTTYLDCQNVEKLTNRFCLLSSTMVRIGQRRHCQTVCIFSDFLLL